MKNLSKQVVIWAVALVCPLLFTSCDEIFGEWDNPADNISSITVNLAEIDAAHLTADKTEVKMRVGEQVTLTFTILPVSMAGTPVTLTSANPSVVAVEGQTIRALAPGKTTVTAQAGDQSINFGVIVESTTVNTVNGNNADIGYGGGGDGSGDSTPRTRQ